MYYAFVAEDVGRSCNALGVLRSSLFRPVIIRPAVALLLEFSLLIQSLCCPRLTIASATIDIVSYGNHSEVDKVTVFFAHVPCIVTRAPVGPSV